ncbi:YwpF family protein [Geomicrobium sp. JSM 1781026]|uniref:YwpF family protein n=1 Tax=Geomicrobium sp. JSM 1781026 TaxID=3344580 RepID=UPI0035BF8D64
MKTFRLKGLRLLLEKDTEPGQEKIELHEGLVINREEGGWWLLEVVVDADAKKVFDQLKEQETDVMMEVIISHENNDPATMVGRIRSGRELESTYSYLIDSKMAMKKEDVFNYILDSLIADGYTGDQLIEEFKNRKADNANWSQQMARSLYEQYREKGSPLSE